MQYSICPFLFWYCLKLIPTHASTQMESGCQSIVYAAQPTECLGLLLHASEIFQMFILGMLNHVWKHVFLQRPKILQTKNKKHQNHGKTQWKKHPG